MNDVYVVHFEFGLLDVLGVLALTFLFTIINCFFSFVIDEIYSHRNNLDRSCGSGDWLSVLLFFTWPLYLLLVLVKCFVGACVYVWRKV